MRTLLSPVVQGIVKTATSVAISDDKVGIIGYQCVESTRTTSMEDVSTGVIEKIKDI